MSVTMSPSARARVAVGATLVAGLALRAQVIESARNLPALFEGTVGNAKTASKPFVDADGRLDHVEIYHMMERMKQHDYEREHKNTALAVPETPLQVFYREHAEVNSELERMIHNKEEACSGTIGNMETLVGIFNSRIARIFTEIEKLNARNEQLKKDFEHIPTAYIEGIRLRQSRLQALLNEIVQERDRAAELLHRVRGEVEKGKSSAYAGLHYTSLELNELGRQLQDAGKNEGELDALESVISRRELEEEIGLHRERIDSYFDFLQSAQMESWTVSEISKGMNSRFSEFSGLLHETNILIDATSDAVSARKEEIARKEHTKVRMEINGIRVSLQKDLEGMEGKKRIMKKDMERINGMIARINDLGRGKIMSEKHAEDLKAEAGRLKSIILTDVTDSVRRADAYDPTMERRMLIAYFGEMLSGLFEALASPFRSARNFITSGLLAISLFTILNGTVSSSYASPPATGPAARRVDMSKQQMYEYFASHHYKGLRQFRDLSLTKAEFNDINELYLYIKGNLDPNMTRNEFCGLFGFQGKGGICLVGDIGPGWLPLTAKHMVELKKGLKVINGGSTSNDAKTAAIAEYRSGLQTLFESAKNEHKNRYSLASVLRKEALRELGASGGSR